MRGILRQWRSNYFLTAVGLKKKARPCRISVKINASCDDRTGGDTVHDSGVKRNQSGLG